MRPLLSFLSWLLLPQELPWVHGYIILALLPVPYLLYKCKIDNLRPEIISLA